MSDNHVPDGYKRCTRGDDCIHPMGAILPSTQEYFYGDKTGKNGLSSVCIECARKQKRDRARVKRQDFAYVEREREQARKHSARPEVKAHKKEYNHERNQRPR